MFFRMLQLNGQLHKENCYSDYWSEKQVVHLLNTNQQPFQINRQKIRKEQNADDL